MKSPFKFLDAFTLQDRRAFFGRDKEVEALYQMAFRTELLLVYGLSGTGKTSLIQCGLASRYDGPDWYPFFIHRGSNINESLRAKLGASLKRPVNGSLAEAVSGIFDRALRPIYLIFDQFEELFILGKPEEQQQFIEDINELLEAGMPCKVLLVMREEYIGHLYYFEKAIPEIFDFRIRVEPMSNAKVLEVLQRSFLQFNITPEPPAEERFQQMIDNLSGEKAGIQLPYLQVYLDMLYRDDYQRTYGDTEVQGDDWPALEFTRQEIEDFGKIETVLEKFLQEREQGLQAELSSLHPGLPEDTVRKTLDAFVTDEGTKRPIPCAYQDALLTLEPPPGLSLPDVSAEVMAACLKGLEKARLLRLAGEQVELAHDSLAALIDQNRSDEQRALNQAKKRINSWYLEYQKTGEYPSQKQLDTIDDLLPRLGLKEHHEEFIQASKAEAVRREEEKEAQRQRELELTRQKLAAETKARKRQRVFSRILAAAALLAIGLGSWAYFERLNAETERNNAYANELASKAFLELKNNQNASLALALAKGALDLDSTNINALKALYSICYQDPEEIRIPFYVELSPLSLPVKGSRFTPTGKNIITFSDSTVQVWGLHGQLLNSLTSKKSKIVDLDISYDDRFLAVAYNDKGLLVYDLQGNLGQPVFTESRPGLVSISFHPYKHEILSISSNEIFVSDIVNKKVAVIASTSRQMEKVKYSADGDLFITTQKDFSISLWNASTKEFLKTIYLEEGMPLAISFNLKGDFVATYEDNTVRIWNKAGELKNVLSGHENNVINSAGFSPTGRYLATTGSDDKIAIIMDYEKDTTVVLRGHKGRVYGTSFPEAEDKILTFSEDGTAKIWNLEGKQIYELVGHPDNIVYKASFSKDGSKALLQIENGAIRVFDFSFPKIELAGHSDIVTDVAIGPGDAVIATGSLDGSVKLWSVTGELLSNIFIDPYGVNHISFSKDGNCLVAASTYGEISFWDISNMQDPDNWFTSDIHEYIINSMAFSGSGRYLASIGQDGRTFILHADIGKKSVFAEIVVESNSVEASAFAFSHDEKLLCTGNNTGIVKIWRLRNEKGELSPHLLTEIKAHNDRINSISFSNDDNNFLTCSEDGWVKTWGLSGKLLAMIENEHGIQHAKYSFDSKHLVYTGGGWVSITDTGLSTTNNFYAHEYEITGLELSNDGNFFITSSVDRSSKLWRFAGNNGIAELAAEYRGHEKTVRSIAIAHNSSFFVSGSVDGTVFVWYISPSKLCNSVEYKIETSLINHKPH